MFDIDLLDDAQAGPELAARLAKLDSQQLSDHDRVVALKAHHRQVSFYQAQAYREMAAISDATGRLDDDPEMAHRSAVAEIRAALRFTRRAAESALGYALDLRDRIPGVLDLLGAGLVDQNRAKTIVDGTAHLSTRDAQDVVAWIGAEASELTTGQLAERLRRTCLESDPAEAVKRRESKHAARRLVCEPTVDGTANLIALDVAPHRAAAIARRVNELARSLNRAGDDRTMDQLRADVFVDLLESTPTEGSITKATVDIRVDLATLAGMSETPGELAGFGPIAADIARHVVAEQTGERWHFAVSDRSTDQILLTGATRRRPTASHRRQVVALDERCAFPGCRMPAAQCDLDHRRAWSEGGPTRPDNLTPLCRHDHVLRHRGGWSYRSSPQRGYVWKSRLGHEYATSGRSP